jgi:hypothetical protein
MELRNVQWCLTWSCLSAGHGVEAGGKTEEEGGGEDSTKAVSMYEDSLYITYVSASINNKS